MKRKLIFIFEVTEKDCKTCEPVLQEMENIDDEAEAAGEKDILTKCIETREFQVSRAFRKQSAILNCFNGHLNLCRNSYRQTRR